MGIQFPQIIFEAAAQDPPRVVILGPASINPPAPALQGTVSGEVKPFNLVRGSLKASVLTHPVPHAFLIFVLKEKEASRVTVELPPEARKLLVEGWKAELAFYYKRAFEPRSLDQRRES